MFNALTIKLICGIVLLVLIGGSIYIISGLRADLAVSESNNIKLKSVITEQSATISTIQKDISTMSVINRDLSKLSRQQRRKIKELDNKFNIKANGTSRDLGDIARAKPTLINRIINRATRKVNRCMELSTSAVSKKGEVNNECPELIHSM